MEFDPKLIELLRKTTTTRIAEELASVQPMPDNLDWNARERAYAVLANHLEENGIEPLLKVRKPDDAGRPD